jgi:bifunctional UDP-N-acetylglucosamine pyrophosphorylase/glucosamine-1-phosphate N-acetyltransferase
MKSPLPKVLHRVGGRTMVDRVLGTLRYAGVRHMVTVVGHGRQAVEEEIHTHHPDVAVAVQEEQLGTGHAVVCAFPHLPEGSAEVGVFSGDTPLLTVAVVHALTAEHRLKGASATLLTAELDDPSGYGRVIRGPDGLVAKIVEEKDATDEERLVTEINAGAYVFDAGALEAALDRVGTENAQGEYYLTDTVEVLRGQGRKVAALVAADDPAAVLGVNDVEQLMEAEALLMERKT